MALDLASFLRDVPDFPKPGIVFKDISPLLASAVAMRQVTSELCTALKQRGVDRVAGIESRGFLFGVPVAMELGVGFTPIRKPGKLPWRTNRIEYVLEYGTDALEIHQDGVHEGERVAVIDDLLATGGTAGAACKLIEGLGAKVASLAFVVELAFLNGRNALDGHPVDSLVTIA